MLKCFIKSILTLFLLAATTATLASTYTFNQITTNGSTGVGAQLQMDVTNSGGNALFTFSNNIGIASSITDIYFDYGNTNYFTSISNNVLGSAGDSTGVNFSDGASPANLPAGNTVGFSADFGADSNSPTLSNGVNAAGEWVAFLGTLSQGSSFSQVLAAIDSGALRVGLHVQGIEVISQHGFDERFEIETESESFVNGTPNAVPLPAAAWLFGSALLGFVGFKRREG